jgi:sialic acid synthase SpsE
MISHRWKQRKQFSGEPMIPSFSIEGRRFGPGKVLVIAEIGTAHSGDLGLAVELIDAAAEAGADCAKFQCVFADEILHPATGLVPLPGGDVGLYDRFKALELDEDFYRSLLEETERRGLIFLCSPFGASSARLLRRIGASAMKIASPELNHLPLLDEIASYGLPVLLSSGVSTLGDIERAVARFSSPLALLHCVTAYPAPEEDYNLRLLSSLASLLGLPVGVSDHSLDPVLVPALSVAGGGIVVEKHIRLSRSEGGLDDPIALEPPSFSRMTKAVRAAQARSPAETLAALRDSHGSSRVEAVLGDGAKRLAPSERENYGRTNRSIHALVAVARGETLSSDRMAILRTEKVLNPGLEPYLLPLLIGRVARRDIASGQGIAWEDVGGVAADG